MLRASNYQCGTKEQRITDGTRCGDRMEAQDAAARGDDTTVVLGACGGGRREVSQLRRLLAHRTHGGHRVLLQEML